MVHKEHSTPSDTLFIVDVVNTVHEHTVQLDLLIMHPHIRCTCLD